MGLLKKIRNLQRDIDRFIDNINRGGCGQFAYLFCENLNKLGIKYSIVFFDYEKIEITYKYFSGISHVMVYIPDIGYIDGKRIIDSKNPHRYKKSNITLKKLKKFVSNKRYWNSAYDTSQNFLLKSLIDEHIK